VADPDSTVSAPSATSPVLFLVFNRPEKTCRVLNAIRQAAPRQLFVASDGPRDDRPDDRKLCAEVLRVIRQGIDWDCRVEYLQRDGNRGCRLAVSSAITWFFENVEEGIILEDDCLPVPQFFRFCTSLLRRFETNQRIGQIGGFNCQLGRRRGEASYYFSRYFHVWGWASWRRAWQGYDVDMKDYDDFLRERSLENLFPRRSLRDFWKDNFDAAASGRADTWDYQWVYRNFKEDRLAVVPNWNMVENIGFDGAATHTGKQKSKMPGMARDNCEEIMHPSFIIPSAIADDFTYRVNLKLGLWHDAKHMFKRLVSLRPLG
jgi:hypothetical protein